MSHDNEASFVTTEVAYLYRNEPNLCFSNPPPNEEITAYATSEGRRRWPISDGVVHIELTDQRSFDVAVEYKTRSEGLHGVLTALGQSHAYLHKGFSGSIIIIPREYKSHDDPGQHIRSIIETTSPDVPIGLFTYEEPDTSDISPFRNRLECERLLNLDTRNVSLPQGFQPQITRIQTQWGHVREGSTDPHAFYSYLKTAIQLTLDPCTVRELALPQGLVDAVNQINQDATPHYYLSNSVGDSFHDRVWRYFWFAYILHNDALSIWHTDEDGNNIVNSTPSRIQKWNGEFKSFFVGRRDSIKNQLVTSLNNDEFDESEAWIRYAGRVRDRAHSYREDIDSGLEAFGLLEPGGRPSELGFRYVDACERSGNCHAGLPRAIFGAALLKNANFGALLHYIYKLSEDIFSQDPFAFTNPGRNQTQVFDRNQYKIWLGSQLSDNLCVMRTVSQRGGQSRQPLQAEFAILRHLEFIKSYRIGVGLEINWPRVQESLEYEF